MAISTFDASRNCLWDSKTLGRENQCQAAIVDDLSTTDSTCYFRQCINDRVVNSVVNNRLCRVHEYQQLNGYNVVYWNEEYQRKPANAIPVDVKVPDARTRQINLMNKLRTRQVSVDTLIRDANVEIARFLAQAQEKIRQVVSERNRLIIQVRTLEENNIILRAEIIRLTGIIEEEKKRRIEIDNDILKKGELITRQIEEIRVLTNERNRCRRLLEDSNAAIEGLQNKLQEVNRNYLNLQNRFNVQTELLEQKEREIKEASDWLEVIPVGPPPVDIVNQIRAATDSIINITTDTGVTDNNPSGFSAPFGNLAPFIPSSALSQPLRRLSIREQTPLASPSSTPLLRSLSSSNPVTPSAVLTPLRNPQTPKQDRQDAAQAAIVTEKNSKIADQALQSVNNVIKSSRSSLNPQQAAILSELKDGVAEAADLIRQAADAALRAANAAQLSSSAGEIKTESDNAIISAQVSAAALNTIVNLANEVKIPDIATSTNVETIVTLDDNTKWQLKKPSPSSKEGDRSNQRGFDQWLKFSALKYASGTPVDYWLKELKSGKGFAKTLNKDADKERKDLNFTTTKKFPLVVEETKEFVNALNEEVKGDIKNKKINEVTVDEQTGVVNPVDWIIYLGQLKPKRVLGFLIDNGFAKKLS